MTLTISAVARSEKIKDFFKNMSTRVRIILAAAVVLIIAAAAAVALWSNNRPYDRWTAGTAFSPSHPPPGGRANDEGYVELPNVDLVKEVAGAMAAPVLLQC